MVRDLDTRAQQPRPSYPTAQPAHPPASIQPAPRSRSAWRSIGTGALGLLGGVLLALIAQDLLAAALLRDGTLSPALTVVLGLFMPVLGVLGMVTALVIDARNTKRRPEEPDR